METKSQEGGWSPHSLSTSGWKPSQDQQCGSWQKKKKKTRLSSLSNGHPEACAFSEVWVYKTDLLRSGTQLKCLQEKRWEIEHLSARGLGKQRCPSCLGRFCGSSHLSIFLHTGQPVTRPETWECLLWSLKDLRTIK